jgi:hypothetical protein
VGLSQAARDALLAAQAALRQADKAITQVLGG